MREPGAVLTTIFAEDARSGRRLVSDLLGDLYEARGVEAAILLRGATGFGGSGLLRSDNSTDVAFDLPLVSIAVDGPGTIDRLVPEVRKQLTGGLVTTEPVTLLVGGLDPSHADPYTDHDLKLTLFLGRHQHPGGGAASTRAVGILHAHGVAGATVLTGLDGTTNGRRGRARFLSANALVPDIVVSVGSRSAIERALPDLDEALDEPFATIAQIRICKRDGRLLAPAPEPDPTSGAWHRLTVFAASGTRHDGRPLGLELVRRLHVARASGATLTRGSWGFSGDHAPHGDRLLSIRRDTPVVTTVVCPPHELASTWTIVDELTREHGLVVVERVAIPLELRELRA